MYYKIFPVQDTKTNGEVSFSTSHVSPRPLVSDSFVPGEETPPPRNEVCGHRKGSEHIEDVRLNFRESNHESSNVQPLG
jgi:hypothetical protein